MPTTITVDRHTTHRGAPSPVFRSSARRLVFRGAWALLLLCLCGTGTAFPGTAYAGASVSEGDTDLPEDTSTPGWVAVGGAATGAIGTAYDQDWFAVELDAGRTYRFALTGSPGGGGTLPDTYFRAIYNSEGQYQSKTYNDNFGGSRDSRVTFTPTESGIYYARVSGDRDEIGTYTLRVTDMTPPEAQESGTPDGAADDAAPESETDQSQNEPANVPESDTDLPNDNTTPGRVAVGGSATSTIEIPYDQDRFAVELEAGRTYRFALTGSPGGGGTLPDTYFRAIYNSEGQYQSDSYNDNFGGSRDSRVTFTPDADGTYYARVSGDRDEIGTYTLSVTDVTPQESETPNGAADDAAPESETDQSQNEPANVPESGTDLPNDNTTPGRVVVGDSVMGAIETVGDQDWLAVELEADTAYRIDLRGSRTGDGTLLFTDLYGIYTANSTLIVAAGQPGQAPPNGNDYYPNSHPEGFNSRVNFTPEESGTYYVAVSGALGAWPSWEATGTYTLRVRELDDFTADTGTNGTVAVGGVAIGEVDYGDDVDWFAVTLEASRGYQIDLKGFDSGDGTLPDPQIRGIYTADSVLIDGTTHDESVIENDVFDFDDIGWNSRVVFEAPESATYYVAASAWDYSAWEHGAWHQGDEGSYTLSVTEFADDPTAGTLAPGALEVGGAVSGAVDYEGDRDWFAVELEAGTRYRFDLKGYGTGDGTLRDPKLYKMRDEDGTRIPGTANNNNRNPTGIKDRYNSRVNFTPEESGTYYVVAGSAKTKYWERTGSYTLQVVTDAFTAGPDTSGTVEVGGSVHSAIEFSNDVDWFAVTLEAGTLYRIDQVSAGSYVEGVGLKIPHLFGIHDADGTLIDGTADDLHNGPPEWSRVHFTPEADGTYYVAAGSFTGYEGAYRLSVEELAEGTIY